MVKRMNGRECLLALCLGGILYTVQVGMISGMARGGEEPSYQGKSVTEWLESAGNEYSSVIACDVAIRKMGKAAVPYLVSALSNDSALIRTGALRNLGFLGVKDAEDRTVISAIAGTLGSDKDAKVRCAAATALERLGAVEVSVVRTVLRAYHGEKSCEVRVCVIGYLGIVHGECDADIQKVLLAGIEDESDDISIAAFGVIAKRHLDANIWVPATCETIEKKLGKKRSLAEDCRLDSAIASLRDAGPAAKASVPTLIKVLQDRILLERALEALKAIGPDASAAVPHIEPLVTDKHPGTAKLAQETIDSCKKEREHRPASQENMEVQEPVPAQEVPKKAKKDDVGAQGTVADSKAETKPETGVAAQSNVPDPEPERKAKGDAADGGRRTE